MITSKYPVVPFDIQADDIEIAALNRHFNRIRLERMPEDTPIPVEETIQNLRSMPDFVDIKMWAAWDGDPREIVAWGVAEVMHLEENQNLLHFDITVQAEYRRQGLGRAILSEIAATAQAEKRTLLMTGSDDHIPGGGAFMERLGAKKGLEAHMNQLRLDELDHGLIEDWLAKGQQNQGAFDLGLWDGPYPEERIRAIVELYDLTNQQPRGDLEFEDVHLTQEQLRQLESNLFARGNQRWTFYVIERASGRFAGYTETIWNPSRPEVLRQDMTGVFPEFRNRGLGRWMKAAMLDKVIRERPEVRFVRTGNADSNAAMLKINTELGFKPYMAEYLWQVELQKVQDYLQAHDKKAEVQHA